MRLQRVPELRPPLFQCLTLTTPECNLRHPSNMRKELDDLLCQRYPEIFCNRYAAPETSSMYWGFSCGDGWFNLIDSLCVAIVANVETGSSPPVIARQVKEKLGRLRFRYQGGNDQIRQLVQLVEDSSETTCETCGLPRARYVWQSVLCPSCLAKARASVSGSRGG